MYNHLTHVAEFLRRHQLENTTGVVAVSGGPDSVALAHLLVEILREGKLERLTLAHVNHGLRGEESDADEAFVRGLPALWQMQDRDRVTIETVRIDAAALAQAERQNLEGVARRERYRWFAQLARENHAAWVATGHTADDQAETVLFRLLRGSGLRGLGAMRECRALNDQVVLLRPLLALRRGDVQGYLQQRGLSYRVDSSNRDTRFTRNRLRLELLPHLTLHYNSGIVDVLCRLAMQAQEWHGETCEQALQMLTAAELARAGDMLVFSLARLQSASANQVREMFRLVWQREGWPMGEMSFDRWNRLVDLAHGSCTAWDFPGFVHARRAQTVLQLESRRAPSGAE